MRLTDHQQEAMQRVLHLLKLHREVKLTGSAGTGKTTLLQELVDRSGRRVILAAPTNKARRVLEEKTRRETFTVHGVFGLAIEEREGRKDTVKGGTGKLTEDALLIIDEASMLNAELYNEVQEILSASDGNRVLYVGDPYQLNPVGEPISEALSSRIPGARLSQVVRQSEGNPIISAASMLRDAQSGAGRFDSFEPFKDGSKIRIAPNDRAFVRRFVEMVDFFDPDYCRAVAWTNARCERLNHLARVAMFGDGVGPYRKDEVLVCFEPVKRKDEESGIDKIIYANGEEVTISDVISEDERSVRVVVVRDELGSESHVLRLAKDWTWYAGELEKLRVAARSEKRGTEDYSAAWRKFYAFKFSFDNVRHCYAVTSHKSQGSTYENVFVDVANIRRNRDEKEMLRSLYVAVTRAKHTAYLNGA